MQLIICPLKLKNIWQNYDISIRDEGFNDG